ncbi:unnamed protein product [Caretta caretta]
MMFKSQLTDELSKSCEERKGIAWCSRVGQRFVGCQMPVLKQLHESLDIPEQIRSPPHHHPGHPSLHQGNEIETGV